MAKHDNRQKIAAGFSVVLIMLDVVGLLSFRGVGGIVKNAEIVIQGNKLDGELTQKEVDHLWSGRADTVLLPFIISNDL